MAADTNPSVGYGGGTLPNELGLMAVPNGVRLGTVGLPGGPSRTPQ
jgi:hypothetical protein